MKTRKAFHMTRRLAAVCGFVSLAAALPLHAKPGHGPQSTGAKREASSVRVAALARAQPPSEREAASGSANATKDAASAASSSNAAPSGGNADADGKREAKPDDAAGNAAKAKASKPTSGKGEAPAGNGKAPAGKGKGKAGKGKAGKTGSESSGKSRKISLEDDFLVEGKLEKPNAYYILRRSQAGYDWARLDAKFLPLVLESVQDPLF